MAEQQENIETEEVTTTETPETEIDKEALFAELDKEDEGLNFQDDDDVVVEEKKQRPANPLADAVLTWASENPEGGIEDFLTDLGYKSSVSTDDMIREQVSVIGKNAGWTKAKIESAIEARIEKYNEMEGIEKELYDAELKSQFKPRSHKLEELNKKIADKRGSRSEENNRMMSIEQTAQQNVAKEVDSLLDTKFLKEGVVISKADRESLIAIANQYLYAHAHVSKTNKLLGFDHKSAVQDALLKKYAKATIKHVIGAKYKEGAADKTIQLARPSGGESGGTQFAQGKSKQEAFDQFIKANNNRRIRTK